MRYLLSGKTKNCAQENRWLMSPGILGQDPFGWLQDWVRLSWRLAAGLLLIIWGAVSRRDFLADLSDVLLKRFFVWFIWRFAPRPPRGFATPSVTVAGVMWHAASSQEYLTSVWRPLARFGLTSGVCNGSKKSFGDLCTRYVSRNASLWGN